MGQLRAVDGAIPTCVVPYLKTVLVCEHNGTSGEAVARLNAKDVVEVLRLNLREAKSWLCECTQAR